MSAGAMIANWSNQEAATRPTTSFFEGTKEPSPVLTGRMTMNSSRGSHWCSIVERVAKVAISGYDHRRDKYLRQER